VVVLPHGQISGKKLIRVFCGVFPAVLLIDDDLSKMIDDK
jgi:hypothetical protein